MRHRRERRGADDFNRWAIAADEVNHFSYQSECFSEVHPEKKCKINAYRIHLMWEIETNISSTAAIISRDACSAVGHGGAPNKDNLRN